MSAILFVIVFVLVATGLGWPVVGRFDANGALKPCARIPFAFALGCYVNYFGVEFIGRIRLDVFSMSAFGIICAVVAIPGFRRMPWRQWAHDAGNEWTTAREDYWLAFLWLVLIGLALTAVLQGLAPPNDYDSLMYHLTLPKLDVERGYIAIAWERAQSVALFPTFSSNLSRIALAISDARAAQMINGTMGLIAAGGAAYLVRFLGFGKRTALLAAIMFIAIRVVYWEMGTAVTDMPVAAFGALALIAYLSWRRIGGYGLAALFGLMVGAAILSKYQGFMIALAFAPVIVVDLIRRERSPVQLMLGPMVALAAVAPHAIRNIILTGNPVFPLFNGVFNPGMAKFFTTTPTELGTGRGLIDLLIAPWVFSIRPMDFFDGMVLGAPYLLAFVPLMFMNRKAARAAWPLLSFLAVYYVLWFFFLSQMVRFMIPIMPVLAALAAVGAAELWHRVDRLAVLKVATVVLALGMAVNQAMFSAAYVGLRLPVGFGLMSKEDFHAKTPTMQGANYHTCNFIRKNLKPGEHYYSFASPLFFYCPQASAVAVFFKDEGKWWLKRRTRPPMSAKEFIRRAKRDQIRFIFVRTSFEVRNNENAVPVVSNFPLDHQRLGKYLRRVLERLTPVAKDRFSAVYDGPQFLAMLKELSAGEK